MTQKAYSQLGNTLVQSATVFALVLALVVGTASAQVPVTGPYTVIACADGADADVAADMLEAQELMLFGSCSAFSIPLPVNLARCVSVPRQGRDFEGDQYLICEQPPGALGGVRFLIVWQIGSEA